MYPAKHRRILYLNIIAIVSCLCGCARTPADVHLEKVHETSNNLSCDKVFAASRDSIVQLNEILVQTGTVDTSDQNMFKAAIIHAEGKELILNLVRSRKSAGNYTELYAGKGYQLELDYQVKELYRSPLYEGHCKVWHGKLHTDMDIVGLDSRL